jgi:hypothetical protein
MYVRRLNVLQEHLHVSRSSMLKDRVITGAIFHGALSRKMSSVLIHCHTYVADAQGKVR